MPTRDAATRPSSHVASQAPRHGARRRWVAAAGYAAAAVALFCGYLRLSRLLPENSDMANILLMASDMLHGNLLLHGWYTSDVSFYTTELPQYALLESFLGLHEETAHVAAAMTYTLAFLLAVMLARSGVSGRRATVRTLIAAGIMIAPQLGAVYAVDLAVGHIGTSVPLLVVYLVLNRAGPRWWVPPLAGLLLVWGLVADPLVLLAGVLPLLIAACVQLVKGLASSGGSDPAPPEPPRGRGRVPWYELGLAAAAAAAPLVASTAERLLRAHGGYIQAPLGEHLRSLHEIVAIAPAAMWQVLDLFGADSHGLHGAQLWFALLHLVSVALVIASLMLVTSRYFGRVRLVDQMLLVAVAGLVVGYVITTASDAGAHEIAPVLPLAAALTARMLVVPGEDRATGVHRAARAGLAEPGDWAGRAGRAAGRAGWAAITLVVAGYLAGLGWEMSQPATPPQFTRLASFLVAHHLTDGLASYWDASIVNVDSGGLVQVRPVGGESLRPYLWMANETWYDPESHRADFLVLSSKPYFGGTWTWQQIVAAFGRPAHEYDVGVFTVLVWHRNLLTSVGG
jgi:hypothetical protein